MTWNDTLEQQIDTDIHKDIVAAIAIVAALCEGDDDGTQSSESR